MLYFMTLFVPDHKESLSTPFYGWVAHYETLYKPIHGFWTLKNPRVVVTAGVHISCTLYNLLSDSPMQNPQISSLNDIHPWWQLIHMIGIQKWSNKWRKTIIVVQHRTITRVISLSLIVTLPSYIYYISWPYLYRIMKNPRPHPLTVRSRIMRPSTNEFSGFEP
jgi:hypothetical protein